MNKIHLILIGVIGIIVGAIIGFNINNKSDDTPANTVCVDDFYYVGKTIPITNDSVEYTVHYAWVINGPSTEEQRLQVNLAIQYITQKYFNRYSNTEVKNKPNDIICDITERIEDSIFAIFPIEFTLKEFVVE